MDTTPTPEEALQEEKKTEMEAILLGYKTYTVEWSETVSAYGSIDIKAESPQAAVELAKIEINLDRAGSTTVEWDSAESDAIQARDANGEELTDWEAF